MPTSQLDEPTRTTIEAELATSLTGTGYASAWSGRHARAIMDAIQASFAAMRPETIKADPDDAKADTLSWQIEAAKEISKYTSWPTHLSLGIAKIIKRHYEAAPFQPNDPVATSAMRTVAGLVRIAGKHGLNGKQLPEFFGGVCDDLAALRAKLAEAERQRDDAMAHYNEIASGLEWTGDGYAWNPKHGDYRERIDDAVRRGVDARKAADAMYAELVAAVNEFGTHITQFATVTWDNYLAWYGLGDGAVHPTFVEACLAAYRAKGKEGGDEEVH